MDIILLQLKIKDYFIRENRKPINSSVKRFLTLNSSIKELMDLIINQDYRFESYYDIIWFYNFDKKFNKCETCGKDLTYQQTRLNHHFCSCKCQANNKELKLIKAKTNLLRYGTTCPSKNELIKLKRKNTIMLRYGVLYASQSKEFKLKVKQTNLLKYGVLWVLASKEIQLKSKLTKILKYGVEYTSQINWVQEKKKLNRISKGRILTDKHFQQCWLHINNLLTKLPLFLITEYRGYEYEYKWKCKKCGCLYFSKYYRGKVVRKCPKCLSLLGYSSLLKELVLFCKKYYPNLKLNIRDIISPYELDIVILLLNIAILFNGDYWHSFNLNNKNYHLNKTQLCNEKGYRLIHIWLDEWLNNKEEVCNKLLQIFLNKLNLIFKLKEIKLDRSWYNYINILNYKLKEILSPKIIKRSKFEVEDCGYLVYLRVE